MAEKFKCANTKCTSRKIEELMHLDPNAGELANYCLKNKKGDIDEKKLMLLRIDVAKWRCEKCFETFLRRKALSGFYHFIETKEPDEHTSRSN